MPKDTILLAYSGGLDTSVCVKWLQEKHDANVVTLTVDLGMVDMEPIRQRALQTGAVDALTVDGREEFVKNYVFPALQAGAVYEEQYPLATALGRPLIAKYMVEAAHRVGAIAIAHGCTGKGNDQVRMDVSAGALDPNVKVIAPVREWGWNREEELEYAAAHGISVPTSNSRFSTDENLWGRSIEAGELEDPWAEPPRTLTSGPSPSAKPPMPPLTWKSSSRAASPSSSMAKRWAPSIWSSTSTTSPAGTVSDALTTSKTGWWASSPAKYTSPPPASSSTRPTKPLNP